MKKATKITTTHVPVHDKYEEYSKEDQNFLSAKELFYEQMASGTDSFKSK